MKILTFPNQIMSYVWEQNKGLMSEIIEIYTIEIRLNLVQSFFKLANHRECGWNKLLHSKLRKIILTFCTPVSFSPSPKYWTLPLGKSRSESHNGVRVCSIVSSFRLDPQESSYSWCSRRCSWIICGNNTLLIPQTEAILKQKNEIKNKP